MRYIFVITADKQAQAQQLIPDGGWTVGLSPNGFGPASHYWCGWVDPGETNMYNLGVIGAAMYDAAEYSQDQVLEELDVKLMYGPERYATAGGSKYHVADCGYIDPDDPNTIIYDDSQAAEAAGKTPCGACIK